jgi:hypothetical protein
MIVGMQQKDDFTKFFLTNPLKVSAEERDPGCGGIFWWQASGHRR